MSHDGITPTSKEDYRFLSGEHSKNPKKKIKRAYKYVVNEVKHNRVPLVESLERLQTDNYALSYKQLLDLSGYLSRYRPDSFSIESEWVKNHFRLLSVLASNPALIIYEEGSDWEQLSDGTEIREMRYREGVDQFYNNLLDALEHSLTFPFYDEIFLAGIVLCEQYATLNNPIIIKRFIAIMQTLIPNTREEYKRICKIFPYLESSIERLNILLEKNELHFYHQYLMEEARKANIDETLPVEWLKQIMLRPIRVPQ
jgi:hypothetical protein